MLGPLAPDDGPYGFNAPTVPPESANPLPVEIAKDIEAISEDGVIYYQNPPTQVAGEEPASETVNVPINDIASDAKVFEDPVNPVLGVSQGPLARKISTSQSGGPLGAARKLKITRRVSRGGKTVTYVVKKGDTLMEIAFDKHGDFLRWREIYKDNRSKMVHWRKMKTGTVLSIHNVNYVYVKKEGKPYLIRKGDTLKSIATRLYGSPLQWKRLWKNNPQLIRNPRKIYAGFTLYYANSEQSLNQPGLREPSQVKEALNSTPSESVKKINLEILKDEMSSK